MTWLTKKKPCMKPLFSLLHSHIPTSLVLPEKLVSPLAGENDRNVQ